MSSISVGLSEVPTSGISFRIRVDARLSGGRIRLGSIITAPPSGLRRPARLVALACAPGALEWSVVAEPVRPYDPTTVGGYLLVEGCEYTGELGLIPLDGSLLESGGPGAGAYNQATGVAPGAAAIPVGAAVRAYSVIAGAALATVAITSPVFGALPVITVPPFTPFTDEPKNLIGPATIAVAGAPAAWWASWNELTR